jgi:hypothetical protein
LASKKVRRLFLSYSRQDRDIVLQVATDLAASRFSIWLDRWELRAGDSIVEKINTALSASSYIVVFLSQASLRS